MAQKVNPSIYRLSDNENWSSRYLEKKSSESYLYQAKDLQLRKFIVEFFKKYGLIIHKSKINYSDNNLKILAVYTQSVNSIAVINRINKSQKFKLIKNKFLKAKIKRKNYKSITKTIKKVYGYETLLAKKKGFKLKRKKSIKSRIKVLKYFKKYFVVKNTKNINDLLLNDFLKKLLISLSIFFEKVVTIDLILKPLIKNARKIIKKKQRELLKKKLIKLKRFERNDFFKDGINFLFLSLTNKNSANLLSKFIAYTLSKLKRHNFFLSFLKTVLKEFMTKTFSSTVKGLQIKIKGRVNGSSRARERTIKIGQRMPVLTLKAPIDYSENIAYTVNGTMGVKVWVNETTNKKNVKRTKTNKI